MSLLTVENLSVTYNGIYALRNVNIRVEEGEVVSVLGPNGAGKSTLLRTISGLVRPEDSGKIFFKGKSILGLPPFRIARKGIAHVPEGRQVFPDLRVHENLEVASALLKPASKRALAIEEVYELFPELSRRRKQLAGTLSGGEQQMLAIGRALVSGNELIMIDEPSMGLAPVIVIRIFKTLKEIMEKRNFSLLLVEQNAKLSLPLSNRIYILSQGSLVFEGDAKKLENQEILQSMYFAK